MTDYEKEYGLCYNQIIADAKRRFWKEHKLDDILAYPVQCEDDDKTRGYHILDIISDYLEPIFSKPLENGVMGIDNRLWFEGLIVSGRIVEDLMFSCHLIEWLNNHFPSRDKNGCKRIQFNKKSRRYFFSAIRGRINLDEKSCNVSFSPKLLALA